MKPVILIAALGLALAACSPAQMNESGEPFSGPGVPGAGAGCNWNNPSAIAPDTPCPAAR